MHNRAILIAEDTKDLADLYAHILEKNGYMVTLCASGAELLETINTAAFSPALLLLDVRLPDMDGLDILSTLKQRHFDSPVIIMTGHASINLAVTAMQSGATDFLVKPFSDSRLLESIEKALALAGLSSKAVLSQEPATIVDRTAHERNIIKPHARTGFGSFVGTSPIMQQTYDVIQSAAKSNATVFITGESGTGKELCAEAVHKLSGRSSKPFVALNCAAIGRDLLESELFGHVKGAFTGAISDHDGAVSQAHGGTLFLDEIAEMTPEMQTKLLRFLQNLSFRKVGGSKTETANVRIVCATNKNPIEEIKAGRLRQDLYYRLHVIPIEMPALRMRRSDILDLADYFLKSYAREERKSFRQFTPEAEAILLSHPWEGNVRELQNIIRGIVVMHEGVTVNITMLPAHILRKSSSNTSENIGQTQRPKSTIEPLWMTERLAIESAIALCAGNIPKAAALLEVSPSTIYRKKMGWEQSVPPPFHIWCRISKINPKSCLLANNSSCIMYKHFSVLTHPYCRS